MRKTSETKLSTIDKNIKLWGILEFLIQKLLAMSGVFYSFLYTSVVSSFTQKFKINSKIHNILKCVVLAKMLSSKIQERVDIVLWRYTSTTKEWDKKCEDQKQGMCFFTLK